MTRIDLQLVPSRKRMTAVGAGFVALDIVEGRQSTFATAGGSCGNVMAALAWMGWDVFPAGRLGDDQAGQFVREELSALGVNLQYLVNDEAISTPIVIQKFSESAVGERTHRFSLSCPGCGGWLPRFRPMTLKQAAPLIDSGSKPKKFYFDRVTPASLKLANWARDAGALILFEPSSVGDERAFQKAVDLCHILKYSHDRLGHIPDLAAAKHPKIVIETNGEDGLKLRWRNRWSVMPAFKAPVFKDAAGSGDWCSAGILHMLCSGGAPSLSDLKKPELERAVRFGQALAAVNCGFEGARGVMGFMDRDKLNQALQALVYAKTDFSWDQAVVEEGNVPDQLCDLCSPPAGEKARKKRA